MKKISKRAQHIGAISIGLSYALLYILSQQIPGAGELYNVSKLVEWTGALFFFLFGLNLELYPLRSAKAAGIAMLAVHAVILWKCYHFLPDLNCIEIAGIVLWEGFIFEIPFALIWKRMDSDLRLDPRPK